MALLSSPTADDLITNIRNLLNQPDANNSFWSDEELLVYMNEGIRRYFAEVIMRLEGQFTTVADLDVVSGVETVDLPSDFFACRALYRTVSQGYQVLNYTPNVLLSYPTSVSNTGDSYTPSYFFRANQLVLRPIPTFDQTAGLRIEYIQFPETMMTGGDTLTSQVSPVFRDLIEMYCVWKAKVKESLSNGTNTTTLAKENLNDLYIAFKDAVTDRSKYPTHTIAWNPEQC